MPQLREQLYQRLVYERAQETLQGEERAAKRAERKVMAKADAARRRRAAQQQFLYTIPLSPKAGQTVEVYYNPDLTVLRGRPEIYMRGCWNRWAAGLCMLACLCLPLLAPACSCLLLLAPACSCLLLLPGSRAVHVCTPLTTACHNPRSPLPPPSNTPPLPPCPQVAAPRVLPASAHDARHARRHRLPAGQRAGAL